MHGTHVPLKVSRSLETVIAYCTNEIVVFVNAPYMIVEIRTTLELFATLFTGKGSFFFMDKLNVVLHSSPEYRMKMIFFSKWQQRSSCSPGSKTSTTQAASVRSTFHMDHAVMGI